MLIVQLFMSIISNSTLINACIGWKLSCLITTLVKGKYQNQILHNYLITTTTSYIQSFPIC